MKGYLPHSMIRNFAFAGIGLAGLLIAVPSDAEVSRPIEAVTIAQADTPTLAQIASSNSSFTILTKLLQHLEVVDVLNDPNSERYTIFAPTDAAFEALPEGTLETLLQPENKDMLRKILAYHVLVGTRTSSDLSSEQYRAATTEDLFLNVQVGLGGVQVNDAKVSQADIIASNGVIHVVDKVLIPQESANSGGVLEGGTVVQTASFVGENDHTVSGQVQIVQKGEVYYLVLGQDFSFDGAPDPRLGFSKNDQFVGTSLFSGLNQDSGQQVYRLPATLDVSNFDEITIWCEQFSVPLAEAKF